MRGPITVAGIHSTVANVVIQNTGTGELVFDNGSDEVTIDAQPLTIKSPVLLNTTLAVTNRANANVPIALTGGVGVADPSVNIRIDKGPLAWEPPADYVFAGNITAGGVTTERSSLFKDGASQLTLTNGAHSFQLAYDNWNVIYGGIRGGTLIFDGGAYTNNLDPIFYPFSGYGGTLEFINGAKVRTGNNTTIGRNYYGNLYGVGSTVRVAGKGTEWDAGGKAFTFQTDGNKLYVTDGAVLTNIVGGGYTVFGGAVNNTLVAITNGSLIQTSAGSLDFTGAGGRFVVDKSDFLSAGNINIGSNTDTSDGNSMSVTGGSNIRLAALFVGNHVGSDSNRVVITDSRANASNNIQMQGNCGSLAITNSAYTMSSGAVFVGNGLHTNNVLSVYDSTIVAGSLRLRGMYGTADFYNSVLTNIPNAGYMGFDTGNSVARAGNKLRAGNSKFWFNDSFQMNSQDGVCEFVNSEVRMNQSIYAGNGAHTNNVFTASGSYFMAYGFYLRGVDGFASFDNVTFTNWPSYGYVDIETGDSSARTGNRLRINNSAFRLTRYAAMYGANGRMDIANSSVFANNQIFIGNATDQTNNVFTANNATLRASAINMYGCDNYIFLNNTTLTNTGNSGWAGVYIGDNASKKRNTLILDKSEIWLSGSIGFAGTDSLIELRDSTLAGPYTINSGNDAVSSNNIFRITEGTRLTTPNNTYMNGNFNFIDIAGTNSVTGVPTTLDMNGKDYCFMPSAGSNNDRRNNTLIVRDGAVVTNANWLRVTYYSIASNSLARVESGGKLYTGSTAMDFSNNSSLGRVRNNVIQITGDGSEWLLNGGNGGLNLVRPGNNTGRLSATGNGLLVEDGGYVKGGAFHVVYGEGYTGVPEGESYDGNFISINGGYASFTGESYIARAQSANSVPMSNNFVRVAGTDMKTGMLDMNKSILRVANFYDANRFGPLVGNYLEAAAYGVVTNISTLHVGYNKPAEVYGNYVRTSGGKVYCDAVEFTPGNGLKPVVTKDHGTGCIETGNVTFANPTYVWPWAEKGAPAGKYKIVQATGTFTNNGIQLAPGTEKNWRLNVVPLEKAVYLTYTQPATLVLLR